MDLRSLLDPPRVQRWVFFTFLLALLPFLLSALFFAGSGNLFRRPELPFFVIALGAATIRDISSFPALSTEQPWIIGSSFLLVVIGAFLYIFGRLPEIGFSVPLRLADVATIIVSALSTFAAGYVQLILAKIEKGT